MKILRGSSWYSSTGHLLRICREGVGAVITKDRYWGFRTFRRLREVRYL